jgi:hypothetical protein
MQIQDVLEKTNRLLLSDTNVDSIEEESNNSSVVAYVFFSVVTFLQSLGTIGIHTHRLSGGIYELHH